MWHCSTRLFYEDKAARHAPHAMSSQFKSSPARHGDRFDCEKGQEGRTTSPQVPSQAHSRASLSIVARYSRSGALAGFTARGIRCSWPPRFVSSRRVAAVRD